MSKKGKNSMIELNKDLVEQYVTSGCSMSLTEAQQEMIDLIRDAYKLIDKHGVRSLAINEFRVLHPEYTMYSAIRYVDCATTFFNAGNAIDRKFLENWALAKLSKIIQDDEVDPSVKVKALSTVLKHLENMPAENSDPKLREHNVVGVIFNVSGQHSGILEEKVLQGLSMRERHALLDKVGNQIDAKRAAEIMEVPYVEVKEDGE